MLSGTFLRRRKHILKVSDESSKKATDRLFWQKLIGVFKTVSFKLCKPYPNYLDI